jgi:hypothetical protein
MEMNLLLRLIIAHLLTDFVFQPKSWVQDREENKGRSRKLYLHVMVTTLVAYMLSGEYSNWIIPVVIFSSHLLIDYLKAKANKGNFSYFIADQIAHLLVIIVLWLSLEGRWSMVEPVLQQIGRDNRFWVIAAGYVFVSWPLGIIIGKATQQWRDQIAREKLKSNPEQNDTTEITANGPQQNTNEQELGLASAGKWIGICERILILTFVLMAQYTAIGFLMTAKSILRFSEKETNTQLKTEYVLVGTLVSFASSAMIGILINLFL